MYELYIANKNYSSWSLRPWLLMRELAIPFEERLMPFATGSNRDRFRQFSPNAKVPCLHDGATIVWDSLAITEYLAERHAEVWPNAAPARAWARSAAAEMHSGFGVLRERCSMSCGVRMRLREMPAALVADIDRIGELWSEGLSRFGGPFLAGPAFTAVDAFYAPVAFRIQTYGLNPGDTVAGYAARLLELPGMRSWYQDALAEPWREPDHEAWCLQSATLLEDLRSAPHKG